MRKQSKKRAAAWLLALCMTVCMTGAAEEAQPQYVYSHIAYSSGTLTPGGQLTASMTVRRTEGAEPLTFALLLYQNDRLIGAETDCQTVGTTNVPMRAAVTLPEDVENCYVNAILWDNLAGMHAICSAGLLPGGSTELKSLTVDGESILGTEENPEQSGNKVYTRTVSTRQAAAPRVGALAADNGTQVRVTISGFPGKAEITTTAADGGQGETHIINFQADGPLAGNIKMTDQLKGTSVDNKDGTYGKSAEYRQNLRPGICPYVDRTEAAMTIVQMPEECIGLDYIAPCIGWRNDVANDYSKIYTGEVISDWTTFTLYRSATIKVFARGDFPLLEANGYTKDNGKTIAMSNGGASMAGMYQKHVDVDSDDGVQIQLPSAGPGNTSWWLAVLDYDGYAEDLLAGNIKMTDRLKGTSIDNQNGTYSKSAEYRQNLRPGICPYADRTEAAMVIASMPEDCIGKAYIAPCIGWNNDTANDYSRLYREDIPDWTTFTLYRSATLKIFTRGNFSQLEEIGYTKVQSQGIVMSNDGASMPALYEKHVDVGSDEGVQIELPSAGTRTAGWWLVVLDYDW